MMDMLIPLDFSNDSDKESGTYEIQMLVNYWHSYIGNVKNIGC